MIRYDPDTSSVILRSTHILDVSVVDAREGEWTFQGRFKIRAVAMTIRIERILKGEILGREGMTVVLEVKQFAPAGDFLFAVPGAWSNLVLAAGQQFLAFSIAESGMSLADILNDPQCRIAFPASDALPDVELTLLAGSPEMSLRMLLSRTSDRKSSYGALFAGYIAARLPELLFDQLAEFDGVMRQIEDPSLSRIARDILFEDLYVKMIMLDPAPPEFVARLIQGTLRVLAIHGTESLRRSLLTTYLPNLLGLEGGAVPKSANAVFEGKPELRAEAAAAFLAAGADGAVSWIQS
jgi:hypothetical protein